MNNITDKIYIIGDCKYVVKERIGHGGFGDVYRAKRIKSKTGNIELYSDEGALKIIPICDKERFESQKFSCNYNEEEVKKYFYRRMELHHLPLFVLFQKIKNKFIFMTI